MFYWILGSRWRLPKDDKGGEVKSKDDRGRDVVSPAQARIHANVRVLFMDLRIKSEDDRGILILIMS